MYFKDILHFYDIFPSILLPSYKHTISPSETAEILHHLVIFRTHIDLNIPSIPSFL